MTTRTVLRWACLPIGWPVGGFVYTPARENEASAPLMQVVFVLVVVLTGACT